MTTATAPQAAYYLVVGDRDIILDESESMADAQDYIALHGVGRVVVVCTDGTYIRL